jgi:hypothetical protein
LAFADQSGGGEGGEDGDLEHVTMASFDLTTKAKELKDIRSLASEITGRGAQLYVFPSWEAQVDHVCVCTQKRNSEIKK